MSELNATHNRAVWFDIPVADLERAAKFYRTVLAVRVEVMQFGDTSFAILEHDEGNGGCLVLKPEDVSGSSGILVYLNANGRLRNAVGEAEKQGGKVIEPVHAIGPHGFRAIILDSEGNRIALHSHSDA